MGRSKTGPDQSTTTMGGKVKAVNGGRIRKVTITEIEDGKEWNWPDAAPLEDEATVDEVMVVDKTTDEMFAMLDDVITDWKIKLEVVVGDGLKRIKKASKEKKTMMKCLPGDDIKDRSNILAKAKEEIINEWKNEVARCITDTHNKINNIGENKVKDTVKIADGLIKNPAVEKKENKKEEKQEKKKKRRKKRQR